ncbi:MAG: YIP1 family protein [Thermoanaerobaculia bacterium]|nr:YIP1 family protein [Thermoanaerobaculia bacterium]
MEPSEEFDRPENPYLTPESSLHEPAFRPAETPEELNPFKTVWIRPRETVRWLTATNPELHVVLLACIAGIGSSLDRASLRNVGDTTPVPVIVTIACLVGPLGGLITLWAGSHLIRLSGSWIGGVGNRVHIKTAMAWALVPAIAALPLWIPQLALFGSEMFTAKTPRLDASPWLWIPFLGIGLVEIVLGVWNIVLLCKMVAEVQGFRSAWRGLANVVLAAAIILVPLVVLVIIVAMAIGLST